MKIIRPTLVIMFFVFSVNLLFAQKQIIINELSQGPEADYDWEWIEYLVLKDSTDIRGVYLDDKDTTLGVLGSAKLLQLKKDLPEFHSVKKGSIIVIYKSTDSTWMNGQDPKLFEAGAPDTDFSDGVIIIPHTDTTFLEKGGWWPDFSTSGENLGIFDSLGVGIFGISYGWRVVPVASFNNGWGMVRLMEIPYTNVAFYYKTTAAEASDSSNWLIGISAIGTPGALNLLQGDVPVELMSFSIAYLDNCFQLNWETATETNNFGFEVERSVDIVKWEKIY